MTRMLRGLVGMLLVAGLFGCEGPGAQGNGIVQVANLGTEAVTLSWRDSSGGSGTEPVAPCYEYARGFGPGHYEITVTAAGTSRSFTLDAPAQGNSTIGIVVAPAGTISLWGGGQFPRPSC